MDSPGYDELLLLQASLVPEEFQWRGTAPEVDSWKSKLAGVEQGEPAQKDTFHFSLRVSEVLGIWLNVSLEVGCSQESFPKLTISSSKDGNVSLDDLNNFVSRRLEEITAEGTYSL